MRQKHYRRWLIAGILLLAALWIASGVLFRDDEPEDTSAVAGGPTLVAVRQSQAQSVSRVIVLQGDLQPEQVVEVRAETSGQVESWHVPRGAAVKKDELLVELALGERESQRRQAQARRNVAQQELEATRQLVEKGYQPNIQLDTAEAELEAAEAELAAIQEEISRTRVRAPIPGRINRRLADTGDYLSAGGPVAEIVNNHPLRATVHVPQHQVGRLQVGQPARVSVFGHEPAEGEVSLISSLADPATRTFRVEVEIPNPDRTLPAGSSAEVEIITEEVLAHQVSPAIVSLDDEGNVGIKTVDEKNRVRFHPVTVIRAERSGLWVTGLPERAIIITVGQGFVSTGQQVETREEEAVDVESDGSAEAGGGNGDGQ